MRYLLGGALLALVLCTTACVTKFMANCTYDVGVWHCVGEGGGPGPTPPLPPSTESKSDEG